MPRCTRIVVRSGDDSTAVTILGCTTPSKLYMAAIARLPPEVLALVLAPALADHDDLFARQRTRLLILALVSKAFAAVANTLDSDRLAISIAACSARYDETLAVLAKRFKELPLKTLLVRTCKEVHSYPCFDALPVSKAVQGGGVLCDRLVMQRLLFVARVFPSVIQLELSVNGELTESEPVFFTTSLATLPCLPRLRVLTVIVEDEARPMLAIAPQALAEVLYRMQELRELRLVCNFEWAYIDEDQEIGFSNPSPAKLIMLELNGVAPDADEEIAVLDDWLGWLLPVPRQLGMLDGSPVEDDDIADEDTRHNFTLQAHPGREVSLPSWTIPIQLQGVNAQHVARGFHTLRVQSLMLPTPPRDLEEGDDWPFADLHTRPLLHTFSCYHNWICDLGAFRSWLKLMPNLVELDLGVTAVRIPDDRGSKRLTRGRKHLIDAIPSLPTSFRKLTLERGRPGTEFCWKSGEVARLERACQVRGVELEWEWSGYDGHEHEDDS